jgi:hypothetical protein
MSIPNGATIKPLVKLGRDPSDCWTWLGSIGDNGCALKQFHGRQIPARRWLYSQLFGPIPAGMVVTTSCGSGQCVNPHHLVCCTMAEAVRASAATTLLAYDVREIRKARIYGSGMAATLAEKYGVSQQTIRDIWRNDSWRAPRPFKLPPNQPAGEQSCSN